MANWNDIAFVAGQLDYIARLNILIVRAQDTLTEVEIARGGTSSLDARMLLAVQRSGLTANLPCGGFRFTAVGDPIDPQDAATRAWVLARISLGGDPSGIPVTSLNVGSLQDGQFLARAGTALVGRRPSRAFPYFCSSF